MHLEIVGTGSAFAEGTNSSFILWDDNGRGTLVDCGSNIFDKLKKQNKIGQIDNLMITHLHQDHSGSAETFLNYKFFVLGQKTDVIGALDNEAMRHLMGDDYHTRLQDIDKRTLNFEYFSVPHSPGMNCLGFFIEDKILYSGDTSSSVLDRPEAQKAKMIIHDVSLNKNPVHASIEELNKAPADIKAKTYFIHYMPEDKEKLEQLAKQMGFAGILETGDTYKIDNACVKKTNLKTVLAFRFAKNRG